MPAHVLIIVCCTTMWWVLFISKKEITYVSIYVKALRGMLTNYITSLLCLHRKNYSTKSSSGIKLEVPRIHSEHGKSAFSYYASWLWNEFQAIIPLETIPSLNTFKNVLQCKMNKPCCGFN